MQASEVLLIVVASASLIVVGVGGYLLARLTIAVAEVRSAAAEFRAEALPLIERLEAAGVTTTQSVQRLHDTIDVSASVSTAVDGATQATMKALKNPVIKTAAFAKGTRRAAQRIKGDRES